MKKCLVLFVVALVLVSVPAMSARIATVVVDHASDAAAVFQAYWGTTPNPAFAGKNGTVAITPFAVPGVLSIVPGDAKWGNFVTQGSAGYEVKSVRLKKTHGSYIQCPNVWNKRSDILQRGSSEIRLWWPLMFEAPGSADPTVRPGTRWMLEVTYYVAGGATGTLYTERWYWYVDASLDSMKALITLFHELPFSTCEVPLISDESLYPELLAALGAVETALHELNYEAAQDAILAFENLVIDNCITSTTCPPNAPPTDALGRVGIYNTNESPACCKLLVDAEWVAFKEGIFTPGK